MDIARRSRPRRKAHIQDTASALRRHLIAHNWQALGFVFLATAASALAWCMAYAICYWLLLLWMAITGDPDARAPARYPIFFATSAGVLTITAWIQRAIGRNGPPPDHKPIGEMVADLALAVPRSTLAIGSNFSALRWLSALELRLAAGLLERIARERQVSIYNAPLDIPDERIRQRVIFSLLLVRVLEIRFVEENAWLHLSSDRPRSLRLDRFAAGRP